MKEKILLIFILFLIVCVLFVPHFAYAHFPATDNNVTVILHVDPYDYPTPNKTAHLQFDIVDRNITNNLLNCTCSISVFEQEKIIYTHSLILTPKTNGANPSLFSSGVPFIFPHKDVYHIQFIGRPKTPRLFQPFNISWDFRVEEDEPIKPFSFLTYLPFILISICSIGLAAFVFIFKSLYSKKN